VNVQRGGVGEMVAAAVNAPLMTQDHLLTSSRSNAEIELDGATVLRLAENSDLDFEELRMDGFRAQLATGSLTYRILRPTALQGEIDTPNIGVRANSPVELRIWVTDSNNTLISVRSGQAEMVGPAGSERLVAGRAYQVRGSAADPEFQEVAPPPRDTFDDWSSSRDSQLQGSRSSQHVPPDVPGSGDLDANGTWVPSTYGQVWQPTAVPAGWAPYSYGQWVYTNYYGWTWVDYAPWGWAPYHYGRWFFNAGFGWCWWPGPRIGFHYWSPAFVGFFSWHSGYRGLGWVPIAPYERFHPWWGPRAHPFSYGGSVLAAYSNANYRGGATFASLNAFGVPGQRFSHLGREQIAGASFVSGRLPVSPSRDSYRFSPRPAYDPGHFVRPGGAPNSFLRQSSAAMFRTRPAAPGWSRPGVGTPARIQQSQQQQPRTSPNTNSGWRRFGDPGSSLRNPQRGMVAPGSNPPSDAGWHRFGRPAPSPETHGFGWGNTSPSRPNTPPPAFRAPAMPRYETPAQPRYPAPEPRFSAPAQPHYSAPPSFRAPAQLRYSAPQPHYSAPQPRYSAPSGGGGGRGSGGGGHGRR
jgi:hypothetical protein